jgi:dephospho-CoA kinase
MKIIGLTGNIASGKTEVAKIFKELGAKVIDADKIAREVVEPGEAAWQEIVEEFGGNILNPDGSINRKKLGEIIFNDDKKREQLNQITHPRIMTKLKETIDNYKKENVKLVIIEAALIVERGGLLKVIDELIVVSTDAEAQVERIMTRDGLQRDEALSRMESQMPISEKTKHATHIIDNSGSLEETRKQVEEVWEKITTELPQRL